MIAVIAGDRAEIERYLLDQGIPSDGIIIASLDDVNASATPTLLLVDETGRIS